LAALASWLCWLHRYGLFLADELGKKFGQQFFRGPRYIVNFQLPAVGRTSKKHTIFEGIKKYFFKVKFLTTLADWLIWLFRLYS